MGKGLCRSRGTSPLRKAPRLAAAVTRAVRQARNLALHWSRQHSKRFVLAPAVDCEIPIKRQNIRCPKLIRQANQAGIRKINLPVSVLSQYLLDISSFTRKVKRNLENPGCDVFNDRFWRAGQVA